MINTPIGPKAETPAEMLIVKYTNCIAFLALNELSPEDRKSLEATKKDTLNQIYKMMEG
jgi:hypothetical protein